MAHLTGQYRTTADSTVHPAGGRFNQLVAASMNLFSGSFDYTT
jgi:hypothetical protein